MVIRKTIFMLAVMIFGFGAAIEFAQPMPCEAAYETQPPCHETHKTHKSAFMDCCAKLLCMKCAHSPYASSNLEVLLPPSANAQAVADYRMPRIPANREVGERPPKRIA